MKIITLKNTRVNAKNTLTFSAAIMLLTSASMSMDTLADRLAKPIIGFNEHKLQDELNALGSFVETDDLSQSDLDLADLEAELEKQEALEIKQKQDAIKQKNDQQANRQLAIVGVSQHQNRTFLSNLYSLVTGYLGYWFTRS